MYCCLLESIVRSFNSGCENANWMPDCRSGSKVGSGLFDVVLAVSHEMLHVPAPHGRRWRTPVDENQSLTSVPVSPTREVTGGATLRDRPRMVENIGTY